MLRLSCKKLLLILCMCSMHSVFGMKHAVDASDTEGMAQKSAVVLKTAGKVLGKTVGLVGTLGLKTLGFTFHHPFLTLGAVGAVCVYSPAARGFVAAQAKKASQALWEKGKKIIINGVNDALGLTTVQQETRETQAQLAALTAASAKHGAQLGRVEGAVDAVGRTVNAQTGDIQMRIANLQAKLQEQAEAQDAQARQQRVELTGHVASLEDSFGLLSRQFTAQGKQLGLLSVMRSVLQQLLINSETQAQLLAVLANGGEPRRLLPARQAAQMTLGKLQQGFLLLAGVPERVKPEEVD
jgi:hypothetical protein